MNRCITIGVLVMTVMTGAQAQKVRDVPQKIKRTNKMDKVEPIVSDKKPLSPQTLWEMGRVSGIELSSDKRYAFYSVANYDLETNSTDRKLYKVDLKSKESSQVTTEKGAENIVEIEENGDILYLKDGDLWRLNVGNGSVEQISHTDGALQNVKISPDKRHILFSKQVLVNKQYSKDRYPELKESDVYIYDDLDYRHWDTFSDGRYAHPFVAKYDKGEISNEIDLLEGKPYYSPQAPFGGSEDFVWALDSKSLIYVCKKSEGKVYAQSTNTDLYRYNLDTKTTENLTEGMMGYDTQPIYGSNGRFLSWLSMKTDGYEADKNDIILLDKVSQLKINITENWDGTVNSFRWNDAGDKIYFTAPYEGVIRLFEIQIPKDITQSTKFEVATLKSPNVDITGILGETNTGLVVSSTSLTRAAELFHFDLKTKSLQPITSVNDDIYSRISETKVEARSTQATDGHNLFSWVIYPPNFDPSKKYPTLLYCQGGPQSAVSQFYSLRWNLQLIASQGYIVIAPNRRGMPGWGVKWNEDISGDWGGQPIRDYLTAIDDLSKESYVDTSRLGAVGASYGGYSVFMLAGVHENRFKTFISHCGLFDMTSWYGTTEELFFANKDLGGPYWDSKNSKSYTEFNPIKYVDKWNTPILIFQGGKDYRVPIGQGLSAFQAAQLHGLKSRLVYLPEENHWVLSGHNAMVWQTEFFGWLDETLNK